ncbi:MAG: hypothetical protein ACLPID_08080 [Beijerinckiaceae bacterium]
MDFEESFREAARRAEDAVNRAMKRLSRPMRVHEDDLTGVLVGNLESELEGVIGELEWETHIMTHRAGVAAEEKRFGADILIHVQLRSPNFRYSKGVLVQAKRAEPESELSPRNFSDLQSQCDKMLNVTPASYVFDYSKWGMRCGSAMNIRGSNNRDLYGQCAWTSYRFFLELFRCQIGDQRITSADPDDLPVPTVLQMNARGVADRVRR